MNPEKVKLAIAPIGWSNDDLPELGGENTFEQCISEMALAGFTGSEVGNKYPKDTAVLKHKLELRKMQICNCWFSSLLTSHPYEETIKAFEKQLDFLYEMGARVIGISEQGNSIQGKPVPVLEQKPVYTEDEWKTIYKGFNEMGRIAKDKGMSMTVHHHMGTGVQTLAEIDRLMENTDPSLVYLLFDSGHLFFADEDPVAVLKKYVGRTRHVHLKDVRPDVLKRVKEEKMSFLDGVRAGVFTVPGDGCIDFPAIFNILDQAGYEGWMVVEAEQDPAIANPFEYALKARQYIRDTTGL